MGTRSLTVIHDEEKKEIAVLYRQFDGYLTGHGNELIEFLKGYKVINGISDHFAEGKFANGMSCLACQLIGSFKLNQKLPKRDARGRYRNTKIPNGLGGFYLHPAGTRDAGEEYIYHVGVWANGTIWLTVTDPHDKPIAKRVITSKVEPFTKDEDRY